MSTTNASPATEERLLQRVIAILAEEKDLDPAEITPESTFEELDVDSFDGISIIFALEEAFDIDIPDEQASAMTSVREIVAELAKVVPAEALAEDVAEDVAEAPEPAGA